MDVHVITADDLIRALHDARPGDVILFDSPEYTVDVPLFVGDDVTLRGAGVMLVDDDGLPVGFQGPTTTTTTIKAGSGLKGNLVTLGNNSSLQRLVLQGASEAVEDEDEGRGGNTVAVPSRRSHDVVSATIEKCEVHNQITTPGVKDSPAGGAILVYTRNPQRGADPRPHDHARVALTLTSSIIQTPTDGKAVFAMNFASRGQVTITLTQNDIRGSLDVVGGMARPDAVDNAKTTVTSTGNRYSLPQPASDTVGWQITGGSTPPFESPSANADSNNATANSTDDRIGNFQDGIVAVGGRRISGIHGTCSKNTVNLTLTRMKPPTNVVDDAADFQFVGALSVGSFRTGDKNAVIVDVFAGTTPPDRLFHVDVHGAGFETGNQLVFKGTLAALQNLDFG